MENNTVSGLPYRHDSFSIVILLPSQGVVYVALCHDRVVLLFFFSL